MKYVQFIIYKYKRAELATDAFFSKLSVKCNEFLDSLCFRHSTKKSFC